MTKIAPDVKRCIDIAWESTLDDSEVNVKRADRQFRALLSVVRAAELVNACARECWINTGRNLRAIRANDRALSRLSAPPRRARAAKGVTT